MQQALDYAEALDIPFVYSSNGDAFLEHDRTKSGGMKEQELSLDRFPPPENLWKRYCRWKGITPEQEPVVTQDYYVEPGWKAPRYYPLNAVNKTIEADDARPLIERMIGPYMGETSRKGQSFNWILDHIRDGHKCATPRALVRLFEQAATKERGHPRAAPPRLLHPTSLRQALEDVSKNHVIQGINNEWPWLHGVKARIAANRLAPWKRRVLQDMLNADVGILLPVSGNEP